MGNMLSDGFSVYDVTAETEEAFVELHLFACHGVHNCGLKKSYKLCSIKEKVSEKNMVFYQTVFFSDFFLALSPNNGLQQSIWRACNDLI